ncbi:MAG TPA: GNAT family N-acetyltransferase [Dehalococcoidia bacterium]|nr:GNAT family N-acetyltransferase [Dehalococcoidia bacterium]
MELNKSHIKPAAVILSQAFWNYPVSTYAYPDSLVREKRLPYFFQYVLHYCTRYGEVYTTSHEMEGIAIWLPSDNYPMTFWKLIRSVPLPVLFGLGWESGQRMKSFGDYIDSVHQRLTPFEHLFLQTIGVDPHFQGKGFAGKLLRPMLARMDEEGLPCYLETVEEADVLLYEHFGFKVVEKSTVPKTSLTNWAMLRRAP